jgi:integrase
VRGTTRPDPWTPRDHSVSYTTLEQILAVMPDDRQPMPGIRQPAAAKLAVAVLMATGVRGVDLARVRRHDVNLDAATVQMPRSGKGKGAKNWTLRLTPEALKAWRAFDAANLYGAFSPAAVSRSFKRAARRVLGRDTQVHLYSLRHSVGADLYRTTGDLATVGRLLGHTPGSPVTEQYARGAHEDVDLAALAAFSARRAAVVAPKPQLAEKLATAPRLNKRNTLQRRA